jgi:hypothetical protein
MPKPYLHFPEAEFVESSTRSTQRLPSRVGMVAYWCRWSITERSSTSGFERSWARAQHWMMAGAASS